MSSGGARARSGPAKDPGANRRERDQFDWMQLPADGRAGAAPTWPTSQRKPTARMRAIWAELWRLPQAVAWERLRLFEQVAWYVQCLAIAQMPKAPNDARRLATQLMPPLGLTHDGMVKNGWAIAPVSSAEQAADLQAATSIDVDEDARSRLKLVMGGQG